MNRSMRTMTALLTALLLAATLAACGGDDDVVTDAAVVDDARMADASEDGGSLEDAASLDDAASLEDAASSDDAGTLEDAASLDDGGTLGDAAALDDAGTLGDGGSLADAGDVDAGARDAGPVCMCDDAVACTLDSCGADGRCAHTPLASRCPARQRCTATGCVSALVCSTDAECPRDADPCTTNEHCDTPSRTCTWSAIDGDGDGEVPLICGGTDCDDSRADVASDGIELCNGRDDDCDGTVDVALDVACEGESTCIDGVCGCPASTTLCDGLCVDLNTDAAHCGWCGQDCGVTGTCTAGRCACPTTTYCGGICTDMATDELHCGACGRACPATATCIARTCVCPGALTACGTSCIDVQTHADNCGACDRACAAPATCSAGTCSGGTRWALQLRAAELSLDTVSTFGATTVVAGHGAGSLGYGRTYTLGTLEASGYYGAAFAVGIDATGAPSWFRSFPYNYYNNFSSRYVLGGPAGVVFAGYQAGSVDYGDGFVGAATAAGVAVVWMGPDGTTQAISSFVATGYYTLTDAAVAVDGAVYVLVDVASAYTFAGVAHPVATGSRLALAKFNADGTQGCALSVNYLPAGTTLGVDSTGAAVLSGVFRGALTIGSSTFSSDPSGDVFVARIDGTCGIVSAVSIDSPIVAELNVLAPAPGSDLLASGTSPHIGRLRADGSFAWELPSGRVSYTFAGGARGMVVAGGQIDATWDIGLAPARWSQAIFVANLDPSTGRALRGWQLPASLPTTATYPYYPAISALAADSSFRVAFRHETTTPLLPFSYPAATGRQVALVVSLDP